MILVKLKKNLFKSIIVWLLVTLYSAVSYSQERDFTPDREVARKEFDRGNYSDALSHYKALSSQFTGDPVYKYYRGACLVEMDLDLDNAITLLQDAIENSSSLRIVPDKAWYYMGRAHQMSGNYQKAIEAYSSFTDLARRREVKELEIDVLIEECERRILSSGSDKRDNLITEEIYDEGTEVNVQDTVPVIKPDSLVSENVESDKNEKVKSVYGELAREALEYQFMADSVRRLADRYRAGLNELSESDKMTVRSKIISLEQTGFEYQRQADLKYREAARLASENFDDEVLPVFDQNEPEAEDEKEKPADSDSVAVEPDIDSIIVKPDTIKPENSRPSPVLSLFSEEYEQSGEIPVNPELPQGLIYQVQVAAFRNPKDISFFNGLGPLSIYRAEGSDINFYYIGLFRKKEDAGLALVKIREKGFSDAFILAIMDGKRISLDKAEQLENRWSDISIFENDTIIKNKPAEPEEPPTLVYRVEVLREDEKIDEDDYESIERVAGNRSLDVLETADNEYVYLIGKFLTFESAVSYADLLYRNGYTDAKVVAYLGKKEIPLETAKELFELYFDDR